MLYTPISYCLLLAWIVQPPVSAGSQNRIPFPGRRINESETFKLSVQVVAAFLGFQQRDVVSGGVTFL